MEFSKEEFLITVIAKVLSQIEIMHIGVGAASPIPGAGALLAREMRLNAKPRVSIIHGEANNPLTDGGRELFDLAGQGRIDAFFLGGIQVDGRANINLVGIGKYPRIRSRFPGSFGSAYMYFMVPTIILFRSEHTRRVFVEKVDFVSAPGISDSDVFRPGGPKWLVTELCLMAFDSLRKRFVLKSVHPGHTLTEVRDNTGFDFEIPECIESTPQPSKRTLAILRGRVAPEIAKTYPKFSRKIFKKYL